MKVSSLKDGGGWGKYLLTEKYLMVQKVEPGLWRVSVSIPELKAWGEARARRGYRPELVIAAALKDAIGRQIGAEEIPQETVETLREEMDGRKSTLEDALNSMLRTAKLLLEKGLESEMVSLAKTAMKEAMSELEEQDRKEAICREAEAREEEEARLKGKGTGLRADDDPSALPYLSTRARNSLRENGVTTLESLAKKSDQDLLKMKNFGRKCFHDVKPVRAEARRILGLEQS